MDSRFIRNFSIVAHIDHGKSTLADQLLLKSGAISAREFRDQVLDDLEIERDRGITVKARAVAIHYTLDGQDYELNLIDTPGHVDFHYEVSRSLAACEGALLLVDAFQGVQAQTVANAYAAINGNLVVIPVVNKIDLPVTRIDEVLEEIETVVGLDATEAIMVSAKQGIGIEEVFKAIIDKVPAPKGSPTRPATGSRLRQQIRHLPRRCHLRPRDGGDAPDRQENALHADGDLARDSRTGPVPSRTWSPARAWGQGKSDTSSPGRKRAGHGARGGHGDRSAEPGAEPLPGYQQPQQMVFCGMYPDRRNRFRESSRRAAKAQPQRCQLLLPPETSDALGFGFRCGFLGLLHMEVIQQRLEIEQNIDLIQTAPNVTYQILTPPAKP